MAGIRDPVHGYVKVTEVERSIIDTPFVQRLRRVHQLAGSYLVYPGAVHTRFEHVIGAMHVAGQIATSLSATSELGEDCVQELRLAALLHDVGHGPFSHMFEEVLALKSKETHEDMSLRIVRETVIRDIIGEHGFSASKISSLSVGRLEKGPRFLNEVIAGGLSADIMDYLLRDSYFTGVEYGKVDIQRVIDSMQVGDSHLVIDEAALPAFEALLLGRYEMFKAVYFHKTVRAAELMLVRSMQLADSTLGLTELSNLDRYLNLTDEVVLHSLTSLRPATAELREARQLALDFRERKLVKCVFERLMQRRARGVRGLFTDDTIRGRLRRRLAKEAGMNTGSIFIDVPTTPSIPYSSSKEVLKSVGLVRWEGGRRVIVTMPIGQLPLVGSIEGFMDVLRVYTETRFRGQLEGAARDVFGDVAQTQTPETPPRR